MRPRKGNIVAGLILVLLGAWFLLVELLPAAREIAYGRLTWPYQIIGVGALFMLIAILAWLPGMIIPGSIIAGIGGLLYYQNVTSDWASWSYAWTLIPAFVGVGLILFGLLKRRRGAILGGLWNLFSAAVLFGIFGYAFARLRIAAMLWPLAIIFLGLMILVWGRKRA